MIANLIRRLRFRGDHRWAPDRMSEYLDGDLDSGGRERIERHVHDCPKCRELLRGLRSMITGLAGIRSEPQREPDQTVVPVVLAGLRAEIGGDTEDERDI